MQLTEDVYLVGSGSAGFGLSDDFDSHVYLLDGGDEYALIDAGGGRATSEIARNVHHDGLDPTRIKWVLLTHYHADHAAGAAQWQRTGARIAGDREGAPWLQTADEAAISLAEARAAGLYPHDYRIDPCAIDVELDDGAKLTVGDLTVEVISTPGHARGHVSYRVAGRNGVYLFVGDLVFYGGQVLLLTTHDSSPHDLRRSIDKVGELAFDALFPGHLTFSLRDGQRHVEAARSRLASLMVPANVL